ncbi:hypothetical protein [Micromonospora sp. KC721]|uniref:hypothetical protein n=1 Tax=Micromonospora sp. KC721 TaxID=2530380 RepID=UPI0010504ECB|nr:hypothetical protein [Micromonospora sp. KC721]TDB79554.1 hypothetical protein E1182_12110 [Micromonospora sp. KC721]
MPTVIVPVGLNLGPSYRYVTPPDPAPEYWEVRLGNDSEELTDEEFQLWGRAFLDPERHARLEINRETLRRDALGVGSGKSNPDAIIDRLLDRGLLIEFDPNGELEKPFRRIRLYPLAEGMGNTPEEPDRRLIGHNGQAHVKVNYTVYGMWAYSSSIGSLWEACVDFETGAKEQHETGEDVEVVAAAEVAGEVAKTLPMLIASGCAFVDLVR